MKNMQDTPNDLPRKIMEKTIYFNANIIFKKNKNETRSCGKARKYYNKYFIQKSKKSLVSKNQRGTGFY